MTTFDRTPGGRPPATPRPASWSPRGGFTSGDAPDTQFFGAEFLQEHPADVHQTPANAPAQAAVSPTADQIHDALARNLELRRARFHQPDATDKTRPTDDPLADAVTTVTEHGTPSDQERNADITAEAIPRPQDDDRASTNAANAANASRSTTPPKAKQAEHTVQPKGTEWPPMKRKPSPEQIAANRKNSKRSTGPRTDEGKAASSMNALVHGGHSPKRILHHGPLIEDPEQMKAWEDKLRNDVPRPNALVEAVGEILIESLRAGKRVATYNERVLDEIDRRHINLSPTDPATIELHRIRKAEDALSSDRDMVEAFHGWLTAAGQSCPACSIRPIPTEADPDDDDAESFCRLLHTRREEPLVWVQDLWTTTTTPANRAEWERALRVLCSHYFNDEPTRALSWLHEQHHSVTIELARLELEHDELTELLAVRHADERLRALDLGQQRYHRVTAPVGKDLLALRLATELTSAPELTSGDNP